MTNSKRQMIGALLAVLFTFPGLYASERDTCVVRFPVFDAFTGEMVDSVRAELLAADSTYMRPCRVVKMMQASVPQRWVHVPLVQSGTYWVRLEREGYETYYYPLHARLMKRSSQMDGAPAYMSKLARSSRTLKLGEAVVQATKIKMVVKGDTVVYNADAFQLSQGSMLDALIEQLPGAELKDDGVITVNGRPVSSLLVNGKDFFKGDPRIALDNLPAYMVDKVKVYEKTSEEDEYRGVKGVESPLVMDVNLKKEYSMGWIANAEGGYGSEKRYLGRVFGLLFTPKSRLAFFGNANNTNDTRRPGRQGDWTPSFQPTGLQAAKTAGAEYSYDDGRRGVSLKSTADVAHYDTDTRRNTVTTSFLPGGGNYGLSDYGSMGCRTEVSTRHNLSVKRPNGIWFRSRPNFSYDKRDGRSRTRSGTFDTDPYGVVTSGALDSLFLPGASDRLRRIAVNRRIEETLTDGYSWSVSVPNEFRFKPFRGVNDNVTLSASFAYDKSRYKTFDHYRLDYPALSADGDEESVDFRNRYRVQPQRHYQYGAGAEYFLSVKNAGFNGYSLYMTFAYDFSQEYRSGRDDLYRLDSLGGWGVDTERGLGELPSTVTEMQQALDRENREHSEEWAKRHKLKYYLGFTSMRKEGQQDQIGLSVPLTIGQERLRYARGSFFDDRGRTSLLCAPSVSYTMIRLKERGNYRFNTQMDASYSYTPTNPDLVYGMNVRNDVNPLYVQEGNPGLHRTHRHEVQVYLWTHRLGKDGGSGQLLYTLVMNGGATRGQVAMGQTYNATTGVYTVRPENVDGNWWANGSLIVSRGLGKKKLFTFSSTTQPGFTHSVDLMGVEGSAASARSVVRQTYVNETMKLDFAYRQWRAGLKAGVNWTNARSNRQGFTTVNAVDYNYGLSARIPLPGGVELNTDLTLFSRRGYEDRSMNTDELVWNARLAKSVMKGRLTFMVDGFDILGQLNNVRRTLNAQGRTETYYNVVPRYVMAHVLFRLNIPPRKRSAR